MKQTNLFTVFCEGGLIQKILNMKTQGFTTSLVNIVSFDPFSNEQKNEAAASGLNLHSYDQVLKEGEKADPAEHPFRETKPEDVYIFSYTSGTTGDSKGVKLAHRNLLASIMSVALELPGVPRR